jgi:hypothetical protein
VSRGIYIEQTNRHNPHIRAAAFGINLRGFQPIFAFNQGSTGDHTGHAGSTVIFGVVVPIDKGAAEFAAQAVGCIGSGSGDQGSANRQRHLGIVGDTGGIAIGLLRAVGRKPFENRINIKEFGFCAEGIA